MHLYHHPLSSNARRAVMTAVHLGSEVDLVLVELAKGEQRKPEFLKRNPNGKVPVLDDDGFFLSESHAIMQYLAEKAPNQKIYPAELRARADVNRWLFWSAHHFSPAVAVLNYERMVKGFLGKGAPDPKEIERGERLVVECANVLDAHLANKTWISNDALTLADLAIASPLMSLESAELPLRPYVHIAAWFERVRALDAWKKTAL